MMLLDVRGHAPGAKEGAEKVGFRRHLSEGMPQGLKPALILFR
jgi:hypothetical protein